MSAAQRHLLSWVRDGLAGQIAAEDPGAGPVPARATLDTSLTLATEHPAEQILVEGPRLALHGPGDVTGIDPRQIVRTDPVAGTTAFEPEHLALVEFDDPALPWRLTPHRHAGQRLRPWLVLVVVDTAVKGVALRSDRRLALPILECPIGELPDLAGSAGWAHAEVCTSGSEALADVLHERPERSVSRLIAPRRLSPDRRYLACVVPAFEHGRLAGLGRPIPAGETSAPAWPGGGRTVTLPVYHQWSFQTGAAGDFPTLARRLSAAVLDPGWLELSYKLADPALTAAVGDAPGLTRMLPALTEPALDHPRDIPAAVTAALEALLHPPAQTVAPPPYLAGHVAGGGWPANAPQWMRELNLDPRLRAAAGLGTEVVRRHQEALMSAAWEQAAALAQVNRELRQGRLGRAVSMSLYRRHFTLGDGARASLSAAAAAERADVVVQRAATALRRIATTDATLGAQLETHAATASTASAEVQRATRPTGPAARTGGAGAADPLPSALSAVAANALVLAPPLSAAADAGVLDRFTGERVRYRQITPGLIDAAVRWWENESVTTEPVGSPGPIGYLTDLIVIQEAIADTSDRPGNWPAVTAATSTVARSIDFDGAFASVQAPRTIALDPARTTKTSGGTLIHHPVARTPWALITGTMYDVAVSQRQRLCMRWCPFSPDGVPSPAPWSVLETSFGTIYASDVTVRRRSGPGGAVEVVLLWWGLTRPTGVGGQFITWQALSFATDPGAGFTELGDIRPVNGLYNLYRGNSIAIDMVPVSVAPGQPYVEPRDIVVATLLPIQISTPSGPADRWAIDYAVGRDFATAGETWSTQAPPYTGWRVPLAPRMAGDTTSATLSIAVTDLDGDGRPELIVYLSCDENGPGGRRRVTSQHVGHGLRPNQPIVDWDTGRRLDVAPLADARNTVCLLGDIPAGRPARLHGLGDNFRAAALRHQAMLIGDATVGSRAQPATFTVGEVAGEVTAALDPAATIPLAVTDRVSVGGQALPAGRAAAAAARRAGASPAATARAAGDGDGDADPLRDRLYEPSFPAAMAEPLRELFPELVFPAADALPDDSVALLGGNSALIAAYMAGLNHEFGRELLWRDFPSSGRATWFRSFFDARSADPAIATGDIREIADWGTAGELAAKTTGAASEDSVILIVRGELLRRYPNVVVLAAEASGPPGARQPTERVLTPAFTGRAGAEVRLFSFAIPETSVRGGADGAGWFFLFAEAPTEPRFAATSDVDWTGAAAPTAAALLRLPFRVAFHASDLLPPPHAPPPPKP